MRIEAYAHKYIVQEFIGNRTCKSVDTLDEAVSCFMESVLSKNNRLFLEEQYLQDFGILCPILEDIPLLTERLKKEIEIHNQKQLNRVPKDILKFAFNFENSNCVYVNNIFPNSKGIGFFYIKSRPSVEEIKYFVDNVKNVSSITKFTIVRDDWYYENSIPEIMFNNRYTNPELYNPLDDFVQFAIYFELI